MIFSAKNLLNWNLKISQNITIMRKYLPVLYGMLQKQLSEGNLYNVGFDKKEGKTKPIKELTGLN